MNSLSSEFSSLLSNALTSLGYERLFNIAFVFTVETGFIPTTLAEHFDSTNSNIELAKMVNNVPLNSFWHKNNNIFNAELVMSNQLCHLTGVPNDDLLIITLSYSNVSKCTYFEIDRSIFSINTEHVFHLSLKYKNLVSVPIKCAILEITVGQYPGLCGIPEELISYIITKLNNTSDLYALMRCCKKLYHSVISNQFLWKTLVVEKYKKEKLSTDLIQQPIMDWRTVYYEVNRIKSGRRTIEIIRE
ncbi:uncharacterized protein LOC100570921 [Acyrthosiphon pisum]|uniref:F-box domain-containing protein n=1 Tax=Acyrthosiphon pisum TaxID=7029 RepID=J9M6V5_ACYPI|nr:uncharacterized protein LOC100570921 [Acyrthosiphon pisum]XP_003245166.1 uncharacterized protein LOC100570921 [Acyrthosiphon pisum]XP_016660646.1 uncharacterized protein LOC100570921 [Acyrthosiphon pisum]|eukprot:XP_003245165.1 PREDICTED: uncharacterized protein LOC100570921 [Acyrthosiphon pisum]